MLPREIPINTIVVLVGKVLSLAIEVPISAHMERTAVKATTTRFGRFEE